MFKEIQNQLSRLHARRIAAALVPSAEGLVRVKLSVGALSCIVRGDGFLTLLKLLPDSAGTRGVVKAIRRSARHAEGWASR